ncbi:hypothetical protein CAAN1_25S00430 [[Candida] anglica]|uniref:Uncharacterized protein n=1 Tax=[Candida] anglica TaxID=148631 RepID=A0ABP0EHY3_9ASCO
MGTPKRHWTTLKVSPEFLKTLPAFTTPKSRAKKVTGSAIPSSQAASPGPETPGTSGGTGALSNYKINAGLKEMSTSGLTMNSITEDYKLDKTSRVRKWTKRPAQFKTFSGFKVDYVKWGSAPRTSTKPESKPEVAPQVKAEVSA